MGLADVVRIGVGIADRVTGGTGGLQVSVTHEARTGQDVNTKPTYGAAVTRKGILTYETKVVRDRTGVDRNSTANLVFLSDVTVTGGDRITLPDGTAPPIVHFTSPADAGEAGARFLTEVFFGDGR